jgi:hypothetical protein
MPISVTDKIKQILAARDKGIVSAQGAILDLLAELRRQILVEVIDAPGESFTAYRLKQSLSGIEKHLADFDSAAKTTIGNGLTHNWEAGADLLPETAAAAGLQTNFYHLSTHTLDALKEFTFGKISGVSGDLYNKLRGELTLGVLGQKTPAQVAATIAGNIKGSPLPNDKWGNPAFKSVAERAEVITGTEMGRAFSLATQKSGEAAKESLPQLKKVWLHAGHPKVGRIIHVYLHGQEREMDKPFYQAPNGYGVQFPRDPNAPISEVIRCGCTHVFHLPEFGDLKAFVADFDSKQHKLWTNG